jgi:nucleoside 2-deoxyribosyltransferase
LDQRAIQYRSLIEKDDNETMPHKIRLYFAAPLFTQAEWQWNSQLRDELVKLGLEVTLPQDREVPMLSGSERFNSEALFLDNIRGIEEADVLLAVLDQADPDSGTCWECGYAYKLGRPIIGLQTDLRIIGDDPEASTNLMLSRSCRTLIRILPNNRHDLSAVAQRVAEAVRATASKLRDASPG